MNRKKIIRQELSYVSECEHLLQFGRCAACSSVGRFGWVHLWPVLDQGEPPVPRCALPVDAQECKCCGRPRKSEFNIVVPPLSFKIISMALRALLGWLNYRLSWIPLKSSLRLIDALLKYLLILKEFIETMIIGGLIWLDVAIKSLKRFQLYFLRVDQFADVSTVGSVVRIRIGRLFRRHIDLRQDARRTVPVSLRQRHLNIITFDAS